MNDTSALAPPAFRREEGHTILVNRFQLAIWSAWLDYWQLVAEYKKQLNAQVYAIALGDLGDLNEHSDAQLHSPLKTDVLNAMLDVVKPIEHIIDLWFIVRGTEAHTGAAGEIEELFALDRDNAVHSPEGTASWWIWRAEIEGVRVHATHHPPTATKLPHKHGQAVARMCEYLAAEYHQYGWNHKPDLAFWAHRHWCAPGWEMGIEGWMTPPLKGLGQFGRRIGITLPNPVGGLICILPGLDGSKWTVRKFLRHPPKSKPWTPGSS